MINKLYDDITHILYCIGYAAWLLLTFRIEGAIEMYYCLMIHLTYKGEKVNEGKFQWDTLFYQLFGLTIVIGLLYFVKVLFSTFISWTH